MSDTTKLILAIVVVVVVVAVIISLFMNARKRRELEHRRFEAGELRARIDEHAPLLQETEDRASVTGAIAADARSEAERTAAEAERKAAEARRLEEQAQAQAAEARRLESHAQKHAEEAASAQSARATFEREADRIDPDVRTDAEGYRVDESGERLPGQEPAGATPGGTAAAVAGTAGVAGGAAAASSAASAPFLRDDDEPDLADAENPFAPPPREQEAAVGSTEPADSHETTDEAGSSTDSAWDASAVGTKSVDHTPDESRDDVSNDDTTTRDETTSSTPDTATSESAWEGSSATGAAAAAGTGAAAGWASRSDDEDDRTDAAPSEAAVAGNGQATSRDAESTGAEAGSHAETAGETTGETTGETADEEPVSSSAGAVQGPVEPEYDDHGLLARDETEETVSVPALEDRDEYLSDKGTPDDDPGDHRGQPWATTTGTPPPDADTDADTGAEEGQATEGALGSRMDPTTETEIDGGADDSEQRPTEGQKVEGPRISSFEEVVDGGFGIGSAAPLADGVQPLGHDVKASRDGNTFLLPGDEGYDDAEPDVWFYNEESARRAGFRKQGE